MEKKQVRDYMTHDVISVDAGETIGDVIRLIRTTHHDGFPVVRQGKVVGCGRGKWSGIFPHGILSGNIR